MAHSSPLGKSPDPFMHNEIRPSDERFRSVYAFGFETWAHLYTAACTNRKLPPSCLSPQDAFPQSPSLPATVLVEYNKYEAFVTASSLWGSDMSACSYGLPSFERPVNIGITTNRPIPLSVPDVTQDTINCGSWFVSDDNYLLVLTLAWTYILSARWAELVSTNCSVEYTPINATKCEAVDDTSIEHEDSNTVYIDIDYADQDEARWWSAILSSSQGWRATMRCAEATFLSPWSPDFRSNLRFLLSLPLQPSAAPTVPTSSAACEYLTRFCIRHNIIDQSHAALSAALLLPSMDRGRGLQLPTPKISKLKLSEELGENNTQFSQAHQIRCPDRLLTLSCNYRGIYSALMSTFYEADIECNTATPWLQGTLSAINTLAKKDACIIGRMCMERKPEVAYLWLGATILGLPDRLLQEVGYGLIPFDLEGAAWSGTLQSFLQQPVSSPLVVQGQISRADECRLLFLSRSDRHLRIPIVQWRPIGATSVEDVDVEVRNHCDCGHHQLTYQGIRWDLVGGKSSVDWAKPHLPIHPTTPPFCGGERVTVSYEGLDRDREYISENSTRNILRWLRYDGWTRDEKEILQHPWFDMGNLDKEEDDSASIQSGNNLSAVRSWLDTCQASSS